MTVEPSMPDYPQRKRQVADEIPAHQGDDEHRRDGQIGRDHPAGRPRQGDGGRDDTQLVTDHHRVGGLQRQVRSDPSQGDPNMRGGQRRSVVHPITDHHHLSTIGP